MTDAGDLESMDEATFRRTVRSWLQAHYPAALHNPAKRLH